MNKPDCVFCNLKDTSVVVYDDELCYAVVSKNPINKYHLLIVPKEHFKHFSELPEKLASHIFLVAKKLSNVVKVVANPDAITHTFDEDISQSGFNLIEHFKYHIIPRFKNDMELIDWSPLRGGETDEVRARYAKGIIELL